MTTKPSATLDDLYRVPGDQKAELVNGELVLMPPTGGLPGYAGGEIFASLREYARRTGAGIAFPDNVGFIAELPHRQSFSPDAAFFTGPTPTMKFLLGAPVFAAEVRSEGGYGPHAEREFARKRADYFAAGTRVVWDVDLLSPEVVRSYRADAPDHPARFRRGDTASAEPAVPGWLMPVDDLFL
ncbi:MAG TPA: Uma2 family endonuclease [Armatimonadota bacterium]|nr:Uma2 family endonuclease [Armatimonadota bacterium]